ncbi:response regulator [Horticoccus sp. 23ND18S-11]|uniref:response regulator n=1 Tax=Horticoccus sp. 23ND18S-11 TaxID=3391832 RepID=UPI0039C9C1E6
MARILLVDDDELLRNVLALTLQKMGHVVVEARNGRDALELCAEGLPDLLFTDLIMPEQEGLETIATIRQLHPAVKIIAMSGGGRGDATDYLKSARLLGADRTLHKPFTQEAMARAIAEVGATA